MRLLTLVLCFIGITSIAQAKMDAGCHAMNGDYWGHEGTECNINVRIFIKNNPQSIAGRRVDSKLSPKYYSRAYDQWVYSCKMCIYP